MFSKAFFLMFTVAQEGLGYSHDRQKALKANKRKLFCNIPFSKVNHHSNDL